MQHDGDDGEEDDDDDKDVCHVGKYQGQESHAVSLQLDRI